MKPSNSYGGINNDENTAGEQRLTILASELKSRSLQLPLANRLVFVIPPAVDVDTPGLPMMDNNDSQLHSLSLASGEPLNEPIAVHENWLLETRNQVLQQTSSGTGCHRLLAEIEEEFRILQSRKVAEWQRQQEDLKLQECAEVLANHIGRSKTYPSVKTGMASLSSQAIV